MEKVLCIIFALWQKQTGNPLAYDLTDGEFYEVTGKIGDGVNLNPLSGKNISPITHFSKDRLLMLQDLKNPENIGKYRIEIGIKSETDRNSQRIEIGNDTEQDRTSNGKNQTSNGAASDAIRNKIGIGKADLDKFSHLYTGELQKTCVNIEKLLQIIFSNTDKKKTIEKSISNYYTAVKLAQQNKHYELKQIEKKLQGIISGQGAIIKLNNVVEAKKQFKKRLAIGITITMFVGIGIFSAVKIASQGSSPTPSAPVLFTSAQIDSAINDFQIRAKTKVYPWRRGKIDSLYKTNQYTLNQLDSLILNYR